MRVLRYQTQGDQVVSWQTFLVGYFDGRGAPSTNVAINGTFDRTTVAATELYQQLNGLESDGVAGPKTIGKAMTQGYDPGIEFDNAANPMSSLSWPPKPKFGYPSQADLTRRFGMPLVDPQADGTLRRVGSVGPYELAKIEIKQELRCNFVLPSAVLVHKRVASHFVRLLEAWRDEKLSHLVRTWAGLHCLRYKRGLPGQLSDHALGIAFDINPAWNGMGKVPAAHGKDGSVRALVPVANELGWYWLGHARNPDGMHFVFAGEP